jgi:hypothetical protein
MKVESPSVWMDLSFSEACLERPEYSPLTDSECVLSMLWSSLTMDILEICVLWVSPHYLLSSLYFSRLSTASLVPQCS